MSVPTVEAGFSARELLEQTRQALSEREIGVASEWLDAAISKFDAALGQIGEPVHA